MEINNKLTVTGGREWDIGGKKGMSQGTCIKDTWTKTTGRRED